MSERKSLTLEELRKMGGKPVWVRVVDHTVFADKEDDFDGYGLVRKSWVRVWDEKRADLIHVDYDFCSYGKEWLAYAYEPPRLDRSVWKPCRRCKTCQSCKSSIYSINDKSSGCYDCDNMGNYEPMGFCPWCGRPLTDAAWEMLEKRVEEIT